MRCPYCKGDNDKVIDSRSSAGGAVIRRRRQCLMCNRRYTTYERVEELPLRVVKKDGRRVPFDRQRILQGMLKACEKRSIGYERLEEITDKIEAQINEMFEREVGSKMIGHLVMKSLNQLDPVAYVRFASVYREFKDVHDFVDELQPLIERGPQDPVRPEPSPERTESAKRGETSGSIPTNRLAGGVREQELPLEDRP